MNCEALVVVVVDGDGEEGEEVKEEDMMGVETVRLEDGLEEETGVDRVRFRVLSFDRLFDSSSLAISLSFSLSLDDEEIEAEVESLINNPTLSLHFAHPPFSLPFPA